MENLWYLKMYRFWTQITSAQLLWNVLRFKIKAEFLMIVIKDSSNYPMHKQTKKRLLSQQPFKFTVSYTKQRSECIVYAYVTCVVCSLTTSAYANLTTQDCNKIWTIVAIITFYCPFERRMVCNFKCFFLNFPHKLEKLENKSRCLFVDVSIPTYSEIFHTTILSIFISVFKFLCLTKLIVPLAYTLIG